MNLKDLNNFTVVTKQCNCSLCKVSDCKCITSWIESDRDLDLKEVAEMAEEAMRKVRSGREWKYKPNPRQTWDEFNRHYSVTAMS